jgi:UDP-N-acetyl-D-mannosaminuronate dehydrogenase
MRARVRLVGYAYKKNSGDTHEAPAALIASGFAQSGATLHIHDPLVAKDTRPEAYEFVDISADSPITYDAAVVVTDHDGVDWDVATGLSSLVLDTLRRLTGPNVELL